MDPAKVSGRLHGLVGPVPVGGDDDNEAECHHVVIVGGGVAGLTAAKTLVERAASSGLRKQVAVTVLEGRDRVGGRIHTHVMGHHLDAEVPVDLGASFVHGCNRSNPVWQLAQEVQAELDTSQGGYSLGWGRRGGWFTDDGSAIATDRINRVFDLFHKRILPAVEKLAGDVEGTGDLRLLCTALRLLCTWLSCLWSDFR